MKVRSNCSETANQSRLFSRDKINAFNAFVHFGNKEISHGAFAGAAIKVAAIFRQYLTRTARTGINGRAGFLLVDIVANANDHESHLQQMRMIVK